MEVCFILELIRVCVEHAIRYTKFMRIVKGECRLKVLPRGTYFCNIIYFIILRNRMRPWLYKTKLRKFRGE